MKSSSWVSATEREGLQIMIQAVRQSPSRKGILKRTKLETSQAFNRLISRFAEELCVVVTRASERVLRITLSPVSSRTRGGGCGERGRRVERRLTGTLLR